jgi:hypothetical protein
MVFVGGSSAQTPPNPLLIAIPCHRHSTKFTMAWGARRGIDDVLLRLKDNDPKLQALYLMGSRVFGEKEALALCDALKGNTALRELNISSHAVSPGMAAAFADMLARPACALRSLSLGNRTFGDQVRADWVVAS